MSGIVGIWYLFICLFSLGSCGSPVCEDDVIEELLASAPVIPEYTCAFDNAFMHSYGSWQKAGRSLITYSITNWPLKADTVSIRSTIRMIMSDYEGEIGIPIREQRGDVDIMITFEKLDGIGGKWGNADFPPYNHKDYHQVRAILDLYDYYASRSDYSFITAAFHELGHTMGMRHSADPRAVMYGAVNTEKKKLTIDDVAGLRLLYGRTGDFTYNDVRFVAIHKGGTRMLRQNFSEKEFWTKNKSYKHNTHWIAAPVIDGFQIIRTYLGVPMAATSSYRDYLYNYYLPGTAKLGKHTEMIAGDGIFAGTAKQNATARKSYEREILHRGPLFLKLYNAGIRGFGTYNNGSIHIDARWDKFCTWLDGRIYCTWGRLSSGFGVSVPEESFINE